MCASNDRPLISLEPPVAERAEVEAGPRAARLESHRIRRRLIGTVVFLGATVLAAAGAWFGWRAYRSAVQTPPDRVVVIGESRSEDGAVVAGLVAIVDVSGAEPVITPVDTVAPRAVPGTSFNTLRDALPMGGAALVARLAAGEDAGWVIFTEEAWRSLLDAMGGVRMDVPTATTVFTGEELFRFKGGSQNLSGAQAGALLLGSEGLGQPEQAAAVRQALAMALADAVLSRPQAVADELCADESTSSAIESSMEPQMLIEVFTAR